MIIMVPINYQPSFVPFDLTNPAFGLIKDVHYFVPDDMNHNTLFVQHVLMLHWSHLQSQGCIPSNHIVWNDGSSCQFKSAKALYFLSQHPNLTSFTSHLSGCQLIWNFTNHGKGEVDGARASLKHEVTKKQIKPSKR